MFSNYVPRLVAVWNKGNHLFLLKVKALKSLNLWNERTDHAQFVVDVLSFAGKKKVSSHFVFKQDMMSCKIWLEILWEKKSELLLVFSLKIIVDFFQ